MILSFRQGKKRRKKKRKKEERIRDVYFPSHVLTNKLHPPQKLIPVYHEITLEWCAPPRPIPRTRKTLNHFPSPALFVPRPPRMSRMAGRAGLRRRTLGHAPVRHQPPFPAQATAQLTHGTSRSSRCNAEPRDRIIRLSGVASAGPSPEPRGPRFL